MKKIKIRLRDEVEDLFAEIYGLESCLECSTLDILIEDVIQCMLDEICCKDVYLGRYPNMSDALCVEHLVSDSDSYELEYCKPFIAIRKILIRAVGTYGTVTLVTLNSYGVAYLTVSEI